MNYDNKEDELNVEDLIEALNDEENNSILELNTSKVKTIKNDILQSINIKGKELKEYHKKLKQYRYVDELHCINYGCYIRWINLKKYDNIKLTNGGFICNIEVCNNGRSMVGIINNRKQIIRLNMENCLVFQKITNQEQILLKVMDYLNN